MHYNVYFLQNIVACNRQFGEKACVFSIKPRDFSVKPRDYGTKPRDFSVKPRDYGTRPRDFSVKPRDYGTKPQDFSVKPRDYGTKPRDFSIKPRDYGTKPRDFSVKPRDYGRMFWVMSSMFSLKYQLIMNKLGMARPSHKKKRLNNLLVQPFSCSVLQGCLSVWKSIGFAGKRTKRQ
jgi:hypothetical protein